MTIYINTNMEKSEMISKNEDSVNEDSVEIWNKFYSTTWNYLVEAKLISESEELQFEHENSNIQGISFTDDCGIPEKKQAKIREIVYASLTEIIEKGWSS